MVLTKDSNFKSVECDWCGKKVADYPTPIRYFEHEASYEKPLAAECNDEKCKIERYKQKSLCSECAKKVPSLDKKNICCGHAVTFTTRVDEKPDWMFMDCADCSMVNCENVKTGEERWFIETKRENFADAVK